MAVSIRHGSFSMYGAYSRPLRCIALLLLLLLLLLLAYSQTLKAAPRTLLTLVQEYNDFFLIANDPFRVPATQQAQSRYLKPGYISAVAARGNQIFFVDSGRSRLFYLDGMMKTISEFAVLRGGQTAGLFVAQDLSVYVIDGFDRSVLHYSRDGRLLTRFNRDDVLLNPVDVLQNEPNNQVIIADSLGAFLAEFNVFGGLRRQLGQNINQASIASSIIAFAAAPGRYYLLDGLSRSVSVMDTNGDVLDIIGQEILKHPVSIATDRCGRIFVADSFDNAIHIFTGNEEIVTLPNKAFGLTGFSLITDIWIDENFLYVADGPAAKIKKYLIDTDC